MAKLGGTKHLKRIAAPKAIPIKDKKERKWITRGAPGPHTKKKSIPLGVLLRDILKVVLTLKEAKQVLSKRMVLVDGKARTDEKFPVGLMDAVSLPVNEKYYRMNVDGKGRLVPVEIAKDDATTKILKVVNKHTVKKGKLTLTFHDGKNMLSDNHIRVGDSVIVSLPDAKLKTHIKRDRGSRCLVMEGTHAGKIVTLKEIIERKGGKPSEALVNDSTEDFITVAKYLFVVDSNFKGER